MGALAAEVVSRIRQMVADTPVLVFMRGTVEQPRCEGSATLARLLAPVSGGIEFLDVQSDPELRAFLPKVAGSADVPLLYISGQLFGGASVANDLAEKGELYRILHEIMPEQRMVS
jgi:monothiol glutaredoxin